MDFSVIKLSMKISSGRTGLNFKVAGRGMARTPCYSPPQVIPESGIKGLSLPGKKDVPSC